MPCKAAECWAGLVLVQSAAGQVVGVGQAAPSRANLTAAQLAPGPAHERQANPSGPEGQVLKDGQEQRVWQAGNRAGPACSGHWTGLHCVAVILRADATMQRCQMSRRQGNSMHRAEAQQGSITGCLRSAVSQSEPTTRPWVPCFPPVSSAPSAASAALSWHSFQPNPLVLVPKPLLQQLPCFTRFLIIPPTCVS